MVVGNDAIETLTVRKSSYLHLIKCYEREQWVQRRHRLMWTCDIIPVSVCMRERYGTVRGAKATATPDIDLDSPPSCIDQFIVRLTTLIPRILIAAIRIILLFVLLNLRRSLVVFCQHLGGNAVE